MNLGFTIIESEHSIVNTSQKRMGTRVCAHHARHVFISDKNDALYTLHLSRILRSAGSDWRVFVYGRQLWRFFKYR